MKINNMSPNINQQNCLSINTWGTENGMFINNFVRFQEYKLLSKCSTSCERNNTHKIKQYLCFESDINNNIVLFSDRTCRLCGKSRSDEIIFNRNPFILIIEAALSFEAYIHDLPKELIINEKNISISNDVFLS